MTDNTDRELFEKVCPVPEYVQFNGVDRYQGSRQSDDWHAGQYNALWQGFQLGRAQDAGKDAERLGFIEKCRATVYASQTKTLAHWVFVDETKASRTGCVGKTLREAIDKAMESAK